MMTILDQLQNASEGNRELDAQIGAKIRYFSDKAEDWMRGWQGPIAPYLEKPGHIACWHTDGKMSVWWSVPYYTTSLDAALTLVPEGWGWSISRISNPNRPIGVGYSASLHNDGIHPPIWIKHEGSPVLALCEAIMKANAARLIDTHISEYK